MEHKGVVFSKNGVFETFTITVNGGSVEYLDTIDALLQTLHSAVEGLQDDKERYYICNIIRAMLPSDEQIELILQNCLKSETK